MQATRHARRVYVGGLPPMANEQSVATFFSQVMAAVGANTAGPGDAVVNVYINQEKRFAFVELRRTSSFGLRIKTCTFQRPPSHGGRGGWLRNKFLNYPTVRI
jgi:hypothetical protein